jgi:UDP-N-acetylmuramyl pentapeptide phosphotransferase/UDP-N-acetylglucosamine-1-phosphate transferase
MLFWLFLSFSLSILLVGVLRRFLISRQIVDLPGQRRLHSVPVARGGGLAMVAAAMLTMLFVSLAAENTKLVLFNGGLLLVAIIGWQDDRRGLGIALRLLVHMLAGIAVWALLLQLGFLDDLPLGLRMASAFPIAISVLASINLHNFIDGAHGMLSLQSLFVLIVLTVLTVLSLDADPALTAAMLCCLGSVFGFLPWNFPNARVFMGDAGSGALGYMLAAFTFWMWAAGTITLVEALLLHSLVLIDGLCTLGFRMGSGRRWWRGHREHLYQWLVRTGRTHTQVVVRVQLWNLLVVVPLVAWLGMRSAAGSELVRFDTGLDDPWAAGALILVFAIGITIWWITKRRLLRAHRAKCRDETNNNAETRAAGHR